MANLSQKLGEMNYDGLFSDLTPKAEVRGKTIRKLGTAATLKRGTILAKDADGKLIVLGSDIDDTGTFSATGDGSTTKFSLVSCGVTPSAVTEVKVDGTETTAYTYNKVTGELEFNEAPANTKTIAVKFVTGGGNADCILCDDVVVGTESDENVSVYTAGCFNLNKVHVATGYTISADDFDALRKYGIVFKAASAV